MIWVRRVGSIEGSFPLWILRTCECPWVASPSRSVHSQSSPLTAFWSHLAIPWSYAVPWRIGASSETISEVASSLLSRSLTTRPLTLGSNERDLAFLSRFCDAYSSPCLSKVPPFSTSSPIEFSKQHMQPAVSTCLIPLRPFSVTYLGRWSILGKRVWALPDV